MNKAVTRRQRRHFLQALWAAGALPLLPSIRPARAASNAPLFLLNLTATGGWDVASFCDPKLNLPGQPLINHWATTQGIAQVGNIPYAPFAANQDFFSQHYAKTLVINGINTRTNSHTVGRLMALTGFDREGGPSLGALYAAALGAGMAMPLMVGSTFETGGLLAPSQINDGLQELIKLNKAGTSNYLADDDLNLIRQQQRRLNAANPQSGHTWAAYNAALNTDDSRFPLCLDLLNNLPLGNFPIGRDILSLRFALCAFAAGLGLAFDYNLYGFDTHDNHDSRMAASLTNLTTMASAAWFYAAQLGIASQLLVVMSSEFGRTPFYNSSQGKDHWPYTSLLVMQDGVPWTNRVIGKTDAKLVGMALDAASLVSGTGGSDLEPWHLHSALRRHLGIAQSPQAQAFKLKGEGAFDFFR